MTIDDKHLLRDFIQIGFWLVVAGCVLFSIIWIILQWLH